MAFPTTSVIETFTYANGNLGATAAWDADYNNNVIYNNQVRAGGSNPSVDHWVASTFGDSEAFMTLVNYGSFTDQAWIAIWIRMGTTGGFDAYDYEVYRNGANYEHTLFLVNNSVWTQKDQDINPTFSAGDRIGIEAIGSAIKAHRYTSGAWSEVMSTTDSTHASGYLAIAAQIQSALGDDFGGGAVVTGGGTAVPVFLHHLRQQGIA